MKRDQTIGAGDRTMNLGFLFEFEKDFCSCSLFEEGKNTLSPGQIEKLVQEQDLSPTLKSKLFLLLQLESEDLIDFREDKIQITHENLVKISLSDLFLLGLPDSYPFDISVKTLGSAGYDNFSLEYSFNYPDGKPIAAVERKGAYIEYGNYAKYILGEDQYRLIEAIHRAQEALKDIPAENLTAKLHEDLLSLSQVKELALKANANIDGYMTQEELVVPEKIGIEVVEVEEEIDPETKQKKITRLEIGPTLSDLSTKDFQALFKKSRKVKNTYSISSEGKTKRVLVKPQVKEALEEIKKKRSIEGKENVEKFIKFPHQYLESEAFDLSSYSNRVYGYGIDDTPRSGLLITDAGFDLDVKIEGGDELPPPPTGGEGSLPEREVLLVTDNIEQKEYGTRPLKEPVYSTPKIPTSLSSQRTLLAHQESGLSWLQGLYKNACEDTENPHHGALLADDMGLGKTLQVLALIAGIIEEGTDKPFLIVAPTSVLESWAREWRTSFPSLLSKLNNPINWNKVGPFSDLGFLGKDSITLVSHDTLWRNELVLGKIDWNIIVYDESHNFKNPKTNRSRSAKAMKSVMTIASTGTPIVNSGVDLWNTFDMLIPGMLGSLREFRTRFDEAFQEKTDSPVKSEELRSIIRKRYLRRTKQDILKDLPSKTVLKEDVPFTKELDQEYFEIAQTYKMNQHFLPLVNRLLQFCAHPLLPDDCWENVSVQELIERGSKLKKTIQLLKEIKKKNEKVIIFTHFKKMQCLLQQVIAETFGLIPEIIFGGTPAQRRQRILDKFQEKEGFNVIIMSPLAVGVGVTVTGANHVVHYTRMWNPARENQATDRVYRIGQKKDVFIYHMITKFGSENSRKTVEESLNLLIDRKQAMMSDIIYPTEANAVSQKELKKILDDFVAGHDGPKDKKQISIKDIDLIANPYRFEAAIAALYQEMGFSEAYATAEAGDRGADVIALNGPDGENLIVQCKFKQDSSKTADVQGIGQVVAATPYYERKLNTKFSKKIVITNGFFTEQGVEMAKSNNVTLVSRMELIEYLEKHPISLGQVLVKDRTRHN